jgi:hypothetical protein
MHRKQLEKKVQLKATNLFKLNFDGTNETVALNCEFPLPIRPFKNKIGCDSTMTPFPLTVAVPKKDVASNPPA